MSSSTSWTSTILANRSCPTLDPSATTMVRLALLMSTALVLASTGSWVVSPTLGADPVNADEGNTHIESQQGVLGPVPDELVRLRPADPARDHEPQARKQSHLRRDVQRVRDHRQISAFHQQPRDLTGRRATGQAHREGTLRNPAHRYRRNASPLLSVMGIAIADR